MYVIGPPRTENLEEHDFGPEDMQSLNGAVDGFSLMTYDYSGPHSPGPNAPVNWIRSRYGLYLVSSAIALFNTRLARCFLESTSTAMISAFLEVETILSFIFLLMSNRLTSCSYGSFCPIFLLYQEVILDTS